MIPPFRRRPALVGALAAASLVAAACSGGSSSAANSTAPTTAGRSTTAPAPSTTGSTAPSTTAAPPPRFPLTGLVVADAATMNRPALVVKIDNHPEARPQTGLNEADVVFEEQVEGITRFFAVFHSADSNPVGPIRSARTTDVNIAAMLSKPLFAWSGGNPTVTRQIREADLTDIGFDSVPRGVGGYGRFNLTNARNVEHTLYANTPDLYALTPEGQGAPAPLFTYRADGAASPVGDPIAGVKLLLESTRAEFLWDEATRTWVRTQDGTPHVDRNGASIAPVNVVVMFVGYQRVPGLPASSLEGVTVGTGEAWVFTDGKLVVGTWERPDPAGAPVFKDATGAEIGLTPGRTWVELPEPGHAQEIAAGTDPATVPFPSP